MTKLLSIIELQKSVRVLSGKFPLCHVVLIMLFRVFRYREVFKAADKSNSKKLVAMKKVLMENEKEGVRF